MALMREIWREIHPGRSLPVPFSAAQWSPDNKGRAEAILLRLERGEPLAYILGRTHFCDLEIQVDASVLIPRPETEELVQWILEAEKTSGLSCLDLCCGSGCIGLALGKLAGWKSVEGWDVSADAVATARKNAHRLGLSVRFREVNLLDSQFPSDRTWDVWVSNPPYVLPSESATMGPEVLDFEPHLALFTPPDDGLLFYRVIAEKGLEFLSDGGRLYFELNPLTAGEVAGMLRSLGYEEVEIRNDLSGKDRMMRAVKPRL